MPPKVVRLSVYHTETDAVINEVRKELQKTGEAMNTTFDPLFLANQLNQLGFEIVEDLGPASIQNRFFNDKSTPYHANENVHLVWAKIK
ncbi:hypothetical protein EJF36_15995 [Bacillus sp. HMF5848]|uniref:hypothetical protein n=1 Tax=Bacillus sp. HMF5848 TaxID=2495421 RepID=UPI000F7804AF|nr:hypothetical protein [Bacillus sp. HMF5848]RSK28264.1 hypothetical protein EJF36_15995 [Bacillus sp. HMF5848]